jgi:hypothetical protein
MRLFGPLTLMLCLVAAPLAADRLAYLDLARRGWNYQLRTTMVGRDLSIPVHINGNDLAGASLCLVGQPPDADSLRTIGTFRALAHHVFGKPIPMRYAGPDASACGSGRTVVLRLYSGHPPNQALSADLRWLNSIHDLGLSMRSDFRATSPAMAQTFFGRRGQGTHIMVKQSALSRPGILESAFYKSILIEELFQSFTFGMDILLLDRTAGFQSKLQETPVSLYRLPWDSRDFMRGLVNSNPGGLCPFDVFMMHAVAKAPVDQTIEPAFIDYIEQSYDDLMARTEQTLGDGQFAPILDLACARSSM